MEGSDKPGTYENLLTVTAANSTLGANNLPNVTATNPTSNDDFEFVIPRKTDVQLDCRQIARAGITKNKGRGTPKSKRRMASLSRKRNRGA